MIKCAVLLILSVFGVMAAGSDVQATTCYVYCFPEHTAGSDEDLGVFWCGEWFDTCASTRIHYHTDSSALVGGATQEYSNYSIEPYTYLYSVFYGDCDDELGCVWTPNPGNIFYDVGWGCTDCPL